MEMGTKQVTTNKGGEAHSLLLVLRSFSLSATTNAIKQHDIGSQPTATMQQRQYDNNQLKRGSNLSLNIFEYRFQLQTLWSL